MRLLRPTLQGSAAFHFVSVFVLIQVQFELQVGLAWGGLEQIRSLWGGWKKSCCKIVWTQSRTYLVVSKGRCNQLGMCKCTHSHSIRKVVCIHVLRYGFGGRDVALCWHSLNPMRSNCFACEAHYQRNMQYWTCVRMFSLEIDILSTHRW